MKKHPKKAEYECRNPRCPVIFVRIHRRMKHVGFRAEVQRGQVTSLRKKMKRG